MRTTLALDDNLLLLAQEFSGVTEKTALVREALKSLIERESARRLAALGGAMPQDRRHSPPPATGLILADTSVWVDHFRSDDSELRTQLLKPGISFMHRSLRQNWLFGSLPKRGKTLAYLDQLPRRA